MPPDVVAERVAAEFGFVVRDASAEEAPSGAVRPAVVAGVLERSAAGHAGLRVGDRVVGVNGEAVGSVDALRRRLQDVALRASLRLRVERRGEPLDLVLPPAQPTLPSQ
jgi:S1-C subfamily serine protease